MRFMLSLKKNADLPFVISDKEMAANPPPKKEKLTPRVFVAMTKFTNIYKIKQLSYQRSFFWMQGQANI
jgi:hypothetical protein